MIFYFITTVTGETSTIASLMFLLFEKKKCKKNLSFIHRFGRGTNSQNFQISVKRLLANWQMYLEMFFSLKCIYFLLLKNKEEKEKKKRLFTGREGLER